MWLASFYWTVRLQIVHINSLLGVIGTSHFNGQNKHLLILFLNITFPFSPVNLLLSGFGDQFIVFEWQLML